MGEDIDFGDDPERALEEITELADEAEQGDLVTFIELMDERGYTNDDGIAEIEDLDGVTLPFYEGDRSLAILLAFSAGAAIEQKYTNYSVEERSVESVQG